MKQVEVPAGATWAEFTVTTKPLDGAIILMIIIMIIVIIIVVVVEVVITCSNTQTYDY